MLKLMFKTDKILGEELPDSTLQLVQIYFDTATFDDIERDKKIKTEAQLSLIGGTMGLLTGFSIISGIEIIFFLFRLTQQSAHTTSKLDHNQFSDQQIGIISILLGWSAPSGLPELMLYLLQRQSFKTI